MDYWEKNIHLSENTARLQVAVFNSFSPEKRFRIALDFANMGLDRTFAWIKGTHPEFSELEVRLEFVRLMYYQTGKISEECWSYFQDQMQTLIRKDWSDRFRVMMKARNWTYEDVARYGRFSNGKVVEATISRGLPAFARLAVVLFEQQRDLPNDRWDTQTTIETMA